MGFSDLVGDAFSALKDDTIGEIGRDFGRIADSPIGTAYMAATHNEVTDFLGRTVGKPAWNHVIEPGLHALNFPVANVKRAASTFEQQNPVLGNGFGDFFSASDWNTAWNRSGGDRPVTFGQASITGYLNLFGKKDWANDSDPYDKQSQDAAQEFYHDTWAGKLSTGALDVSMYALDPLIVLGKVSTAVKGARTLVAGRDVEGAVAAARPADEAVNALAKAEDATPAQKAAVEGYAGFDFDELNLALRKGEEVTGPHSETVKHLDDLLANSTLPAETTLYRTVSAGSSRAGKSHFPTTVSPGQIIEDPGYFSTSNTVEGATSMIHEARAGRAQAVVVEMAAPAGTKAIDVNALNPTNVYSEETEMLLGRGTKYKVLSEEIRDVTNDAGKVVPVRYIQAELVGQKQPVRTYTKSETRAAEKLKSLYEKTDGMTPSAMANLPEFRSSGDAGAIANFFEMANQQFPENAIKRHQMKSDIMGSLLGDATSIQRIKDLGEDMAHNIFRMGEPPVPSAALLDYSRSDYGAKMIRAWNGTNEGFDSVTIQKLTKQHEDEYERLEALLDLQGSTSKIASTATESLGAAIRNNKLTETLIPRGLGGRPMRFVVGNATSRVPGSVHLKDPSRGFQDLSNVIAQMKNTSVSVRREIADSWVKAGTVQERRKVVQDLEATMFRDAAAKWNVSEDAARQFARDANGRQAAYVQGLKDRVYSASPQEKLIQFVDPEDDMLNVYGKAFLRTHLEDTTMVTDPRDLDAILRNATNRRLLERRLEGTRLEAAGKLGSSLTKDFLESTEHWLTAVTRAWKDSALMRLAYPIRIQVDTQLRTLAHLGMLEYMMNLKYNVQGTTRYALQDKEGQTHLVDLLKGGFFREGNWENALAPQLLERKTSYAGVDTTPARSREELQGVTAAIRSRDGAAADIGNDISTRELRKERAKGDWGKIKPGHPEWFDHWTRAVDQIRTSPTARFAVYEQDPAVIKAFVNKNPEARKEWAEFKNQSANQDEWIARVQGHVDHYLPTPELRSYVGKPENAKALFDVPKAERVKAAIPTLAADRQTAEKAVKDQVGKVKTLKAKWDAAPKRSLERKNAKAELVEARQELASRREARWSARAEHQDAVAPPRKGLINHDPATDNTINPGGKVEPMDVHGMSYSPLTKTGVGQRWAKIREGFYRWAADAPETIIGRSPIYAHSFRTNMIDTINRLPEGSLDLQTIERIRRQSDRKARQDMANILFDASNSSNASHALRLVSPFFSAWEDTMKKWSKLIGNDPTLIGKGNAIWNAPNQLGLVVDSEGYKVDANGNKLDDDGQIVTDKNLVGQGENIIVPAIPGMSKLGVGNLRIRKSSANILFQGEPPWLPGVGPLVAIPTNQIAKEVWVKQADSWPLRYVLPFGITDDSVGYQLLPKWVKDVRDSGVGPLGSSKDNAQIFTMLYQQELTNFNNDLRTTKPTTDEIKNKTRNWFLMRAALDNAAPVSIAPTPKNQFYIDKAREYKKKYPEDWSNRFYDDFPKFFEMAQTLSSNETGMVATEANYDAAKVYKGPIAKNPELGWFFAGAANLDGTWSPDVNTWMRSHQAGQGKNFHGTKDPAVAIKDSQVQKGWVLYTKMDTLIDLEMEKRGLYSLNQKGAEDLAAMKRDYVTALGSSNIEWRADHENRNSGAVQNLKTAAENEWKANPKFASRYDQKLLGYYFTMRDQVKAQLDARDSHGIINPDNRDIKLFFDNYVSQLRKASPVFEQIYSRVLESDDISKDLS